MRCVKFIRKKTSQYFSNHPTSDLNLRKIVTSVRHQMMTFQTASGVFSMDDVDLGTRVLIDNLLVPKQGPFLDLGAGYGPIAIWLYKELCHTSFPLLNEPQHPQIYASEVNDRGCLVIKS